MSDEFDLIPSTPSQPTVNLIIPTQPEIDTTPRVAPPPMGKKKRFVISSEYDKPNTRFLSINGVAKLIQVDQEVIIEEEYIRMMADATRPMTRQVRGEQGNVEMRITAVRAHGFQVLGDA